ncbi:MAG TPA: replication-relaxation family protein [Fimbriimonas sp.]|nr:replication-relaxation family protein [Fimbriimonas sp.]
MPRDVRLLRDLALSHVLGRDQIIQLGYFSTVTRANTRLRMLRAAGFVSALPTPFHGQFLYTVGPSAKRLVGERISSVIESRRGSPRFLQHSLMTTNCRIALREQGWHSWRFEAQLRRSFRLGAQSFEVRPDGMMTIAERATCIEVDMGHTAPSKFAERLIAYDLFQSTGEAMRQWGIGNLSILTITTGIRRAQSLAILSPKDSPVAFEVRTFESLGVGIMGDWS